MWAATATPGECSPPLSHASVMLGEDPGLVRVPTIIPIWFGCPCSLAAVAVSPTHYWCIGSCHLGTIQVLTLGFCACHSGPLLLHLSLLLYITHLIFGIFYGYTLVNTLPYHSPWDLFPFSHLGIDLCHFIHTYSFVSWQNFYELTLLSDSLIFTPGPHIYSCF